MVLRTSSPQSAADSKLPASDGRITNRHYDQSPDLFRLFLDPSLKYSSGLYLTETDSLEQAQFQKMEFIARQLGLRGGESVLDIGCGWGSLLCFLAKRYGCSTVGVTPAAQQVAYIRGRAKQLGVSDRVRVERAGFEETVFPSRSFHAITLVGSIVHMADKRKVLAECYRLGCQRARLYLSETCFRNGARQAEFSDRPGTSFVRDAIFGWGDIVPLSAYVEYCEDAGFSLAGLTDLTRHYSRTIDDWSGNVLRNQARLEALHRGIVPDLLRYFEVANAGWGYTTKQYAITVSKCR